MAVTASTVDTASMRADLPGLRRFLTAAVTSLLVADLAAVGVVVAARRDSTPRPAAAAASPTRTVAVITTPDGQRLLADPTTARGQLAIRDAIEHGGSVSNITVPDTADNGQAPGLQTPFAIPHADDVLTVPLGSTLDRTIDSVLASAPIGPGAGGGGTTTLPGSPLTSLLNDTQSTLLNTVTTVQNTVSTLLNTVTTLQSTVTSLGNTASTTVGTTVTSLQGTVTTLQGTVTTLQSTVTTAPSLVGGTVSTLTSTVSSVVTTAPLSTTQPVSTTLPPSPPTTTTICTLLVHC